MDITVPDILFGNPAEWEAFANRQPRFLERFGRLATALKSAFIRSVADDALGRFVFASGKLATDDLWEILLLSGNSEAPAAEKVLRGMFERVVDLAYIRANPEELDYYLDWYWVQRWKQLDAERKFRPKDAQLPQDQQDAIEKQYQGVKDKFVIPDCKKCGTTRMAVRWSRRKDLVQLAVAVELDKYLVHAYFRPLAEAHSTVKSMVDRMESGDDGDLQMKERLNPERADIALCAAHGLILRVLSEQIKHFNLPAADYAGLARDYEEIWDPASCETHP